MPHPFKSLEEAKDEIANYIRLRLGEGIIDTEADFKHIDMAINLSLLRYRQMSAGSTRDAVVFVSLVREQSEYILPEEVMEVRQVFRHGVSNITGNATTQFEPFSAGYLNSYMLPAGRVGGLLTYELFAGYQELIMKMFGGFINFTFDRSTKKLYIYRRIVANGENVGVLCNIRKSDITLLNEENIFTWLMDYAHANTKFLIGEAREKFGGINGPQGSVTLNGSAMKAEGQKAMEGLETELRKYIDGSMPMSFIVG